MRLAKDEQAFAERMLFHVLRGKTPIEAAEAVISDDVRLFNDVMAYSYHERESAERASVRRAISDEVYTRLRAA